MKGFIEFIREQGIMGLAIGFLLGGSVQKVATSLVNDIIYPSLSIIFGGTGGFENAKLVIGKNAILWGHFLTVITDFLLIALVVYFVFKGMNLEKVDKRKTN